MPLVILLVPFGTYEFNNNSFNLQEANSQLDATQKF